MTASMPCPKCGSPLDPCKCERDQGVQGWNSTLHQKTRLRRSTRLRAVREGSDDSFRRYYGSEERVRWIKSLPCMVPGCDRRPSDAAHVKSRGAGGGPEDMVPLCRPHHTEQHTIGIKTFQALHNIDLQVYAEELAERWDERNENTNRRHGT